MRDGQRSQRQPPLTSRINGETRMIEQILAALLALAPAHKPAAAMPYFTPDYIFWGIADTIADDRAGLATGAHSVAVGVCAQIPRGNGNIALGARTTVPPGASGFVNIGNRWCGWIATGKDAPCPPPVSEAECK